MSSAANNQSPIVDHWYYKAGGEEFGPITSSQLKELAKRGTLGQEDLVRQRTATMWTKAKQVKGLFPAEGWFARIADKEYGPMSSQELVGLAKQLRLGPDDDVRRSDQMNWTKANRVQGLFGVSDGPTNVKKQPGLASNSTGPRSLTHHSTGTYLPSASSTATTSNPPVQSGMSASPSSERSAASARRKRVGVSWQKLSLGAFAIVGMIWGGLVFFATPPQAEQEPTVVALKPSIAEKKNPEPRPISNVKAPPFTAAPVGNPVAESNQMLAFLRTLEPEVTAGLTLKEFFVAQPDSQNGKLTNNADGSQYLAWGGGLLSGEALFFRGKIILYRRSRLAPDSEVIRAENELLSKKLGPPDSTASPPDAGVIVSWNQWYIDRFTYITAIKTVSTNRGVFDYHEHCILVKDADK